jgi:hypothetical protein
MTGGGLVWKACEDFADRCSTAFQDRAGVCNFHRRRRRWGRQACVAPLGCVRVIDTVVGLSTDQSGRANWSSPRNLLEIAYPVSREAAGASVHPRPVRELDHVASAQGRIG